MENRRPPSRFGGNQNRGESSRPREGRPYGDGRYSYNRPGAGPPGRRGDGMGRKPVGRGPGPQNRSSDSRKPIGPWDKRADIKITSEFQLTDGKYRGKFFKTNSSPRMVPTNRRLRELMFKILSRRVRAGRFLDLCSGCGTIGLEAISRGAMLGTFVERSARMTRLLKKNLEEFGILEGHSEVVEAEAAPFLKRMLRKKRYWDVVYFCVPTAGADEIFRFLSKGAAVARGGVLVVEHPSDVAVPEALGVLKPGRVFNQDGISLTLYERPVPAQ